MDSLADLPHICNPVLYVFRGVLMRIGISIKEIKDVSVFTGYGELHGLYTHSRSGVVHATTLEKLNQRQLRDVLSSKVKQKRNDYHLSCIGMWFSAQNMNIRVREVLQKKADTLNEGETCFCLMVDKSRTTFGFEDIDDRTRAFFLLKDTICKIDIKILKRESNFQTDSDFIASISSDDHMVVEDEKNGSFNFKDSERIGTEMIDLSGKSKQVDKPASKKPDSENPFKPSMKLELPVPEKETENTEESASGEVEKEEKKPPETETDNLTERHEGMICEPSENFTEGNQDGNSIDCEARQFEKNNHPDHDGETITSEESQMAIKDSALTKKKSLPAETTTGKEHKIDYSTTGEEGIFNGAISTKESEIENGQDSDSSVAQQSEENGGIETEYSTVANEDDSTVAVFIGVENNPLKDEGGSATNSTIKYEIEEKDDIVIVTEKSQISVHGDSCTTIKSEIKEKKPPETENRTERHERMICESAGNSTEENQDGNTIDCAARQIEENNHPDHDGETITSEVSQIAIGDSALTKKQSREEGIINGANSTRESEIENGQDSDSSVAQQSEENGGIETEYSAVANEDDSTVAVFIGVEINSVKDEGGTATNSTIKYEIEEKDDIVIVTEKSQISVHGDSCTTKF